MYLFSYKLIRSMRIHDIYFFQNNEFEVGLLLDFQI
jgi:hypothetical protein